jgi:peptide/nickel transport system permease protein
VTVEVPEVSSHTVELARIEALVHDHYGAIARGRSALRHNVEITLPAAGIIFMVLACFLAPLVFPIPGPNSGNLEYASLLPFSSGHILGTDPLGNDILSRLLYGGRASLEVGFGSCVLGFLVGGTLGIVAGYKGGIIELIIMRVLDMFLALPALVLAITIATYLGPSEIHVIWAISFFSVPAFARLARAHTLRLREEIFILSAKLSGQKDRKVMLRHIAPNIIPSLLTFSFLFIGVAIVAEAGLSFLGLGIPLPQPSWGSMISVGQTYLGTDPYLVLIPSLFLFFTILCLIILGDALRARWSSQ